MKRILTFILTLIVLSLGALMVFSSPWDPLAIIIGMFLVSVAILNLAVQIYFPVTPEQTVELKVVEEPSEAPKESPREKTNVSAKIEAKSVEKNKKASKRKKNR